MSDEEFVKQVVSGADLYGYSHGKVRVESPEKGVLGDMSHHGTREKRRSDAWASARAKLKALLEVPDATN